MNQIKSDLKFVGWCIIISLFLSSLVFLTVLVTFGML